MAILADLMLRLRANSADLQVGIDKAKTAMKDANKAASDMKSGMKNAFGQVQAGLDRMIPGFSAFTNGIGKAISTAMSFAKTMNIVKIALISTGIGALIVALGSLVALFTKTDRGADLLSEKLAGIKTVIGVLVQRLALFGEGIMAFLKMDFKGGIDKMKEAFSNLGDEISRAYEEGEKLKKSLNDLADIEAEFILTEAELSNKIKLAREIINDEAATYAQKQKAINDAAKAETELYQKQKAILWEKYRITKEQNDIARRNGEDNEDFLAAENTILAEIENINGERAMAMTRISKMQDKITKDAQKEAEERVKALEALKEQNGAIELAIVPALPASGVVDPSKLVGMTPVDITPKFDEEKLRSYAEIYQETWSNVTSAVKNMLSNTAITSTMLFETLTLAITESLKALSDTLAQGAESFKEFGKNALNAIRSVISGLIAEGITAAVTNALKSTAVTPWLIPVVAAAAAGLAKTAFITLIPKFADGGIAFGPTMGLVGEYAGARHNPEIIAPLDKLQSILGTTGMTGEVRFVIEQDKLVGILSDYSKKQMYF